MFSSSSTLSDLGEKQLISEIIKILPSHPRLLGGFGHDSAFIDVNVNCDEVLLLNTDRSGSNIAFQLDLTNAECVGDFGISHAVSDIFASGGEPVTVSIALMLPKNTPVSFVRELMTGAVKAAKKYGTFISCGDTKHNPKFAMVVTAVGKGKKNEILTRSKARPGDWIVVSGALGTMTAGLACFKKEIPVSNTSLDIFKEALIFQNPPYKLARAVTKSRLACACMDNSDGLASSLYTLCKGSGVGAEIFQDNVPIRPEVLEVAQHLGIDPFLFALSSGDWQYLYVVPDENIEEFKKLLNQYSPLANIIGRCVEDQNNKVILTRQDGSYELNRIENDRFGVGGSDFFDQMVNGNIDYLGNTVKNETSI